ncbi:response regulator [Methylobacterium oryzihabitans]|uniref:Response regulator n=1 Tax=Methylobacterium oryzihabitans TaxID=2499852 RepID=A0A3S2V8L8_9HYPH|nr:response regulator transcription factor [Methylobacterium oryzihabitans]RVU18390.1 response regulator [Methylobacterium oryzihabitans]
MPDSSVLVVDDHPVILRACGMVFEEAHAAVYCASDVEEGYRCFVANRPAVVVADLTYRDGSLSGLALIARIRALAPEARILVFSMHDDPTVVARALAAGATGYLLKDTTTSDLLAAFHRVRAGMLSIDHRLAIARREAMPHRFRQDIRQDTRHHTRSLS